MARLSGRVPVRKPCPAICAGKPSADPRPILRISELPLDYSVNQYYIPAIPPAEGRFAIVTIRWAGMRWTLRRQAGSLAGRNRCSVRRSRVVLAPRPWRLSAPPVRGGNGGKKRRSPGRARISRKAIAWGKPGCLGCTCSACPCASHMGCPCAPAHGIYGRSRRPAFPAPLLSRGATRWNNSREIAPRG